MRLDRGFLWTMHKDSAMSDSFVYAIASEWAVKIGVSNNPANRLAYFQIGNPSRLDLIGRVRGAFKLEARIHKFLTKAGCRVRGEWFEITDLVMELLSAFWMDDRAGVEAIIGPDDSHIWKSPLEPTIPLEVFLTKQLNWTSPHWGTKDSLPLN